MFLILPTSQYVKFWSSTKLPSLCILHFGPLQIGELTHNPFPPLRARRELGFHNPFLFLLGGRRRTSSLHHVRRRHHLPLAAVRAGSCPSCACALGNRHRRQARPRRSGSTGTTPSAAPTHPQSAPAPAKSANPTPRSCAAASSEALAWWAASRGPSPASTLDPRSCAAASSEALAAAPSMPPVSPPSSAFRGPVLFGQGEEGAQSS
jgi:hypothetical protein